MSSISTEVYSVVKSLPIGAQFTTGELKNMGLNKYSYGRISSHLYYLVNSGRLRKVTLWDKVNPVKFELISKDLPHSPPSPVMTTPHTRDFVTRKTLKASTYTALMSRLDQMEQKLDSAISAQRPTLNAMPTKVLLEEIARRSKA